MRFIRLSLVLGLVATPLFALQEGTTIQQQQQRAQSGERQEEKKAPELSTEQRRRAAKLLQAATANSTDLSPAMRAYALSQIARAYSRTQPAKVGSILEDAFQAAIAIPQEERFKVDLERDILRQLLPVNRTKAEELLPQAEPQARKDIMSALTQMYIKEKKFDQAHDEIQQIAQIEEFPYEVGTRLMQALPKEEIGMKQSIFSEALASYIAHTHKGSFSTGDFPEMVVRFHRILPANQILQAIDEIFKQAKDVDATIRVSSSEGGNATFNSYYEYRLFELLPALREIDPGKADNLVRDYQNIQALSQQYPNGLQSFDPSLSDTPPANNQRGNLSFQMSGGKNRSAPPMDNDVAIRQALHQIEDLAKKDPAQALSQARALPVHQGRSFPRRDGFMAVIANTWKDKPMIARSALQEVVKSADGLDPADKIDHYVDAARYYIKLEDNEEAQKLLEKCPSFANDAIHQDTNADNPNKALKAYWPSANSWRKIVQTANQISPDLPNQLIKEISDPEIKVLTQVDLAKAVVGAPNGQIIVAIQRGKQNSMMMTDDHDEQ
jgi:hypothetical protein